MTYKNILYITITFLFRLFVYSQDIHWSQFNNNPIFLNPGNVGKFIGDIRFTGNFRDQWRSVTRPYNTFSFSIDSKIKSIDNLGYGFLFFHDVAGDGNLRTIEAQGNIAYQIKLTKDSLHNIRSGINIGINHRNLDFSQYYFDNQYDGISYNPSISSNEILETDSKTNFTIGFGAIYQYYKNNRLNYTFGISAFNLNQPNQGFYNEIIKRDIRINVFGSSTYKINYDWELIPSINLSMQGKFYEFMLGSSFRYTIVNKLGKYRAINSGLWYRHKDAGIIYLGMDYQNFLIGLSYDINFSKLTPASRNRGGFEISFRYILTHFKPKKITHRICPDFI